ncbi:MULTISPECIES: cyclase family protein [unclassified Diaminobutyricimonas]|uniref:cyclase family protein n=1 Tax=unclassified Diaminobutyricimonas TaxID=2643261 RepID=UPI0012F50875|nr:MULTISPECIES: cyclase family protein [unclassified Diaminobutyricimonas]
MRTRLPKYRELPIVEGGARSAWHLFGESDEIGLINLLTADKVAAAARLVVSGRRFPLMVPIGFIDPPLYSRGSTRHTVYEMRADAVFDDYYDNYYPQSGSQWDSLAHYGYKPGVFYNGATPDDIRDRQRNGIQHWAEGGIAGRGVLLDFARTAPNVYTASDPYPITVDNLERVRREQGVELREGDILLIRTGFLEHHVGRTAEERTAQATLRGLHSAGLEHSEEMAEYLWDSHVSAVVMDNPGIEVSPPDYRPEAEPFGVLHRILIGQFGMALGELWWLKDLADECFAEQRWEFLLASAPLNVPGGMGSPANAIAIM